MHCLIRMTYPDLLTIEICCMMTESHTVRAHVPIYPMLSTSPLLSRCHGVTWFVACDVREHPWPIARNLNLNLIEHLFEPDLGQSLRVFVSPNVAIYDKAERGLVSLSVLRGRAGYLHSFPSALLA